jgi:nitric oxide reductase large subunit
LYIAPAVSGYEPKYQVLGVNILFGALLIVVFGSLAGQWLGVMQKLGYVDNFLWGHPVFLIYCRDRHGISGYGLWHLPTIPVCIPVL